jgi:hypothetical protein
MPAAEEGQEAIEGAGLGATFRVKALKALRPQDRSGACSSPAPPISSVNSRRAMRASRDAYSAARACKVLIVDELGFVPFARPRRLCISSTAVGYKPFQSACDSPDAPCPAA